MTTQTMTPTQGKSAIAAMLSGEERKSEGKWTSTGRELSPAVIGKGAPAQFDKKAGLTEKKGRALLADAVGNELAGLQEPPDARAGKAMIRHNLLGGVTTREAAEAVAGMLRAENREIADRRQDKAPVKAKNAMSEEQGHKAIAALLKRSGVDGNKSAPVARNAPDTGSTGDVKAAERRGQLVAAAHVEKEVADGMAQKYADFVNQVAAYFPMVRTEQDVARLAVQNPAGYVQFMGLREQARQFIPSVQEAQHKAAHAAAAAFKEIAEHEDAQFFRRNPKVNERDEAGVTSMLTDHGLSMTELTVLYNTVTPIDTSNPVAFRIIEDAARFHTGKPLNSKSDLWPAIADTLNAAGFSDEDIGAIGNGAPVCLRDHRVQTLVLYAYRHQQRTRQRP